MTRVEHATWKAKHQKRKDHNLKWRRPCIFCGETSKDYTEHYFGNEEPACSVLTTEARSRELIGPEEELSFRNSSAAMQLMIGLSSANLPYFCMQFGET
jgi:hypothetical protein